MSLGVLAALAGCDPHSPAGRAQRARLRAAVETCLYAGAEAGVTDQSTSDWLAAAWGWFNEPSDLALEGARAALAAVSAAPPTPGDFCVSRLREAARWLLHVPAWTRVGPAHDAGTDLVVQQVLILAAECLMSAGREAAAAVADITTSFEMLCADAPDRG